MTLQANIVRVFLDLDGAYGSPIGIVWASPLTYRREREVTADLGVHEAIFIDELAGSTASARIFTPTAERPFSPESTIALAALLNGDGDDIQSISVAAGTVRLRFENRLVYTTARPEWTPPFELDRLATPDDVDAVDPDAYGLGLHYVWSWLDEPAGLVRARMFAPDLGIREDESSACAAVRLSAELARDLEIRQGEGSVLRTHVRYLGQQVEVGGRVSDPREVEL